MPNDSEHQWEFWGDDPYIKCDCGALRDALTGRVIKEGDHHAEG